MWTKTLGGGDESGYAVRQTSDGGYVICGLTSSCNTYNKDAYLIRLAPETRIAEKEEQLDERHELGPPIIRGPLILPVRSGCELFDISGRKVEVNSMIPGIYYILEQGKVIQKIIRIR